ncbi:hypothetical protein FB45DRAFT_1052122 [Roridomyces roridus]|uniref:Uncharacterized protein n=1 Tax=Roridomyces roridus TaxID=1738132 RepID=A0AAD7CFY1_9AGAR|nr:hypothetical protein FB45DRAFT_1052122 [Roridomyces roridus]
MSDASSRVKWNGDSIASIKTGQHTIPLSSLPPVAPPGERLHQPGEDEATPAADPSVCSQHPRPTTKAPWHHRRAGAILQHWRLWWIISKPLLASSSTETPPRPSARRWYGGPDSSRRLQDCKRDAWVRPSLVSLDSSCLLRSSRSLSRRCSTVLLQVAPRLAASLAGADVSRRPRWSWIGLVVRYMQAGMGGLEDGEDAEREDLGAHLGSRDLDSQRSLRYTLLYH